MSEFRAAYRYALAVIGVAEEIKKLDEVSKDFEYIEQLIAGSHEFLMFLKSPVINQEKKKTTLNEIFNGKVTELTMKFIMLLASKGREGLLPEITKQFYKLRDERLGILSVTTTTTVPFKPEQETSLVSQLEQATKKKIRLSYVFDSSLKGGFTVQHEDTVWDASVRHELENLRRRFTGGTA
jgi:F-type H+-transporting ATPase subunit delta